jgi:hypothetical protein
MQSIDQSTFSASGSRGQEGFDPQAKVADVAGQAQEKAHQAAGQMQDKLREQIDRRSTQTAEQIAEQAADLRAVGESLREQGKDGPAAAADRVAGYAEKVGGYLQEKDSHALLADAEQLGRRQPWAAAAGGLALGFVASRFLKASSRQRYQRHTVARPAGVYSGTAVAGNGNGNGQPREPVPYGAGHGPVM